MESFYHFSVKRDKVLNLRVSKMFRETLLKLIEKQDSKYQYVKTSQADLIILAVYRYALLQEALSAPEENRTELVTEQLKGIANDFNIVLKE